MTPRYIVLGALVGVSCYKADQPSAEKPLVCQPRRLAVNSEEMAEQSVRFHTQCSVEPDGALAMYSSIDAGQWAICTFGHNQDLSSFDADAGNEGFLEVVFCMDATVLGDVQLWYGYYPKRKYLTLYSRTVAATDGAASASPSCHVRYFSPADACFDGSAKDNPGANDNVPPICAGKCGETPSECKLDFSNTKVALAVEHLKANSTATVRLASVRYFPQICACSSLSSCVAPFNACRRDEAVCNPERAACRGGVCTLAGVADCGDMVGRYREGWKPGRSDAFTRAYVRHYPSLGCPFDNQGGPYVHPVWGVELQDYLQVDPTATISSDGQTALIYSTDLTESFLVFGRFWGTYKCLRDGGEGLGGASLLGAPTEDRYLANGIIRQGFALGWLTQEVVESGDTVTTVHLRSGRSPDPDALSDCSYVRFAAVGDAGID